ncbi:ABC transporter permease [Candidatus Dependentiae bacterium]|nr:ABC transporter permease [Candidatus Dependentiae bacterium]
MITFSPIWAITIRHLRLYKHDLNLFLMILFWPLLDVVTWGFLGSWIQESGVTHFKNYTAIALLGVLLWQIVGRGANGIALAFNEELWQNNILNLFSLPLRLIEWSLGTIVYFAIMVVVTALCGFFSTYALYDVSIWKMAYYFLIFLPPLFFSAIWLGFLSLQIVVLLGKRGVELGFVVVWFLLPFSGAYYPIEILPSWGQAISAFCPMSYVFSGMRAYAVHQQDPTSYLIKGYCMSIFYAVVSVGLFIYLFNLRRHKGIARLAD